jgi:hypothetical protein
MRIFASVSLALLPIFQSVNSVKSLTVYQGDPVTHVDELPVVQYPNTPYFKSSACARARLVAGAVIVAMIRHAKETIENSTTTVEQPNRRAMAL